MLGPSRFIRDHAGSTLGRRNLNNVDEKISNKAVYTDLLYCYGISAIYDTMNGFTLCLHFRDFAPCGSTEQIILLEDMWSVHHDAVHATRLGGMISKNSGGSGYMHAWHGCSKVSGVLETYHYA